MRLIPPFGLPPIVAAGIRSPKCCAGLLAVLAAGISTPSLAANCHSSGALTYLGNTRDASRSVWLSGTVPGSFLLESAQGQQTVKMGRSSLATLASVDLAQCLSRQ